MTLLDIYYDVKQDMENHYQWQDNTRNAYEANYEKLGDHLNDKPFLEYDLQDFENALTEIKGVGISLAKTICRVLDLDLNSKIGYIADEDVAKIEEIVENPKKFGIPSWMLNRREDYETGDDIHLIESDLDMILRDDLNRMKKTRSYKGRRHEVGLPVRGQRTKSTFRKSASVGVRRS